MRSSIFAVLLMMCACQQTESEDSSSTQNDLPSDVDTEEETDPDSGNNTDTADNTDTGDQTESDHSEPTICTESSGKPGGCECSTAEGFTTYRFKQDGSERCLTTYVDPEYNGASLPLVLLPDCYTENALQQPEKIVEFARMYNVRTMELSSPTGGWDFPFDNEINMDNYLGQCEPENSTEMFYMEGMFSVVDQMIADGTVDPSKIYISGFSQNAMFALFSATCFPERIQGISQGGCGLYSQEDGALALPRCEGACKRSDFETYDVECVTQAPCDTCNYFPVLPTISDDSFKSCILIYDNDEAAHSTAVPAHRVLTESGHDASLHIFASSPDHGLGGHNMPLLDWEWSNSCLEVNPQCSDACASAVNACVGAVQDEFELNNDGLNPLYSEKGRATLYGAYHDCRFQNASLCPKGCAATPDMLLQVQVPACDCDPGQTDCDCTTSDVPGQCNNQ